jgi:CHAD domain-containing protein
MKSDEIQVAVKEHFKIIDRLFHKIIIDFNSEDIRELRIEIKKLRSLLRLLNMESVTGYRFRITKKLKTFYGYIGIIRNLQLHVKNINTYCMNSASPIPELYLLKIEKEIQYWKTNAKNFMDLESDFYNDEETMLSELPVRLKKISVKRFLEYVFHELTVLLKHSDDDEILHSIRKLLQDVVYNLSFIHDYIAALPDGMRDEVKTLSCVELLETLRDKCIDLVLLKTYVDDDCTIDEKKVLQQIDCAWQKEKEEVREKIYQSLNTIHLTHERTSTVSFDEVICD